MATWVPPKPKSMTLVLAPKVQQHQALDFSIAQRQPFYSTTTPAPPCSSDGWHDIDDFSETAPRLPLAGQGASTSNSIHTHTPSSRLSSEPLHDSISTEESRHARSEATTPSSSPPPRHYRASPENQLSHEGRLHTGRGVADTRAGWHCTQCRSRWWEGEAAAGGGRRQWWGYILQEWTSSKPLRRLCQELQTSLWKQCHPEYGSNRAPVGGRRFARLGSRLHGSNAIEGVAKGIRRLGYEDTCGRPAKVTATRGEGCGSGADETVGDIHLSGKADGSPRPAERLELLPDHKTSPATSHDEAGCNSHSGDELNNTESDKDAEEPLSKWYACALAS